MVQAIGDNHDHSYGTQRKFTADEATGMLPLIRRIAADLVVLSHSVERQREQLRGLSGVAEMSTEAPYADEVREVRRSLAADEVRLQGCLRELTALGVEPHIPIDGGIDFPAEFDRRTVRLCWHPDDEVVAHWHEIGQPLSTRKPLPRRLLTSSRSGSR